MVVADNGCSLADTLAARWPEAAGEGLLQVGGSFPGYLWPFTENGRARVGSGVNALDAWFLLKRKTVSHLERICWGIVNSIQLPAY